MITVRHFQNKQEFKQNENNFKIISEAHIVSYTTKKGNIKVVKNRNGKHGKFTKVEYLKMIEETVIMFKMPSLDFGVVL
jgi:uncharacterized protein (UPF0333 family)